jgi:methionyl-tRNA formyltransferase
MRIVYFGTAPFAVPALRALAASVALVVTQPDRPSGRGMRLQPSPVKRTALELGLRVGTPERCRDPSFLDKLREIRPCALLVAAYGQILPQAALDSARRGGINLHGSILPFYRGPAPVQRTILAGETETGVSLMQMDQGMDAGDVIAVERTPIGPDETAGELAARLAGIAARMAAEWMPRIAEGDYPRAPQDSSRASLAPKVLKGEARLDPAGPGMEAYRRFRAFTPSPGAFLDLPDGPLKVLEARLEPAEGPPGAWLAVAPAPLLAFAGGALRLLRVQPAGRRAVSGADWANGARLRPASG